LPNEVKSTFNFLKMRKLKTLLTATLFAVVFVACNEQTEVTPSEPEFVEVAIPDAYKSPSNGRVSSDDVDDLIMDIQITTTEGKEIVGKVHLIMPANESLSYFAITENLLEETGLSADYWIEAFNSNSNGRIARGEGCFATCRGMAKGEGRGTCKAECWLDIAVKVATIVALVAAL